MKSALENTRLVIVLELIHEGILLLVFEDCGEYHSPLGLLLGSESLHIQYFDWVELGSKVEELEVQFAPNLLLNVGQVRV